MYYHWNYLCLWTSLGIYPPPPSQHFQSIKNVFTQILRCHALDFYYLSIIIALSYSPPPFRGRVLRLIYIFSLFVHNALSRCKCIFVLLRYMRRVSHCIISFITSMHFFTARSFLSLDLPRFAYFISALFGCDYPKEFLRFLM